MLSSVPSVRGSVLSLILFLIFINEFKGTSGLEVIKLEFILRLKIKRNDWLLVAIIALYFESEIVLKFYNLNAWSSVDDSVMHRDIY